MPLSTSPTVCSVGLGLVTAEGFHFTKSQDAGLSLSHHGGNTREVGVDGGATIRLLSDLHIGSSSSNTGLIVDELDKAQEDGSRVILGGDIMDMLLPGDRRRYAPHKVSKDLQGRSDLVNAEIDKAYNLLQPYAHLIDAIGTGNHETEVEKLASFDPVQDLIQKLNWLPGFSIGYLGYTGFVVYPIYWNKNHVYDYTIWFHHGSGKCSNPSKALSRLLDAQQGFQADLYWSGHSHTRGASEVLVLSPGKNGRPVNRHVWMVITGSYQNGYEMQSGEDLLRYGRRGTYPSDAGLRPLALGGAKVTLEFNRGGPPSRVHVEM